MHVISGKLNRQYRIERKVSVTDDMHVSTTQLHSVVDMIWGGFEPASVSKVIEANVEGTVLIGYIVVRDSGVAAEQPQSRDVITDIHSGTLYEVTGVIPVPAMRQYRILVGAYVA